MWTSVEYIKWKKPSIFESSLLSGSCERLTAPPHPAVAARKEATFGIDFHNEGKPIAFDVFRKRKLCCYSFENSEKSKATGSRTVGFWHRKMIDVVLIAGTRGYRVGDVP